MAIRRLLGLDHLPKLRTVGALATGYGLAQLDLDFTSAFTDTGGTRMFYQVTGAAAPVGAGWLQIYNDHGTASYHTTISFSMAKVGLAGALSFIMGCRVNASALTGRTILGINVPGVGSDFAFVATDLPSINEGHYVEFKIDIDTGVMERWVNGVQLANKTLAANVLNGIKAGNGRIFLGSFTGFNLASTVQNSVYYRDFYFMEVTDASNTSKRLGNVTVSKVPFKSASGAGFTPSSGTLESVLNTNRDDASLVNSPIITGPNSAGTLTALPNEALAPLEGFLALSVSVTAAAKDATPVTGSVSVDHNATPVISKDLGTLPLTSSHVDKFVGVVDLAGAAIDDDYLAALAVKISGA